MTPRRLALAAAIMLVCVASVSRDRQRMPDWSGQWENVGGTPDASGGFNQSLDDVLKNMQWSPPNRPELQAKIDKIVAGERKRLRLSPAEKIRAEWTSRPARLDIRD